MTPEQMEYGRIGIELMTSKADGANPADFLSERINALVQEYWVDGQRGRTGLLKGCIGLGNVATALMFMLGEKTGQTEEEILQDVARYFHAQN